MRGLLLTSSDRYFQELCQFLRRILGLNFFPELGLSLKFVNNKHLKSCAIINFFNKLWFCYQTHWRWLSILTNFPKTRKSIEFLLNIILWIMEVFGRLFLLLVFYVRQNGVSKWIYPRDGLCNTQLTALIVRMTRMFDIGSLSHVWGHVLTREIPRERYWNVFVFSDISRPMS